MSIHLPEIRKKGKKSKIQKRTNFNISVVQNPNDTTIQSKSKLGLHAFVVDTNVQNNYSAYRLNNNSNSILIKTKCIVGVGGGPGPKKIRVGFHGELTNMEEYKQMQAQQIHNFQSLNLYNNPSFHQNYEGGFQPSFSQLYSNYRQSSNQYPLVNKNTAFTGIFRDINTDRSYVDPSQYNNFISPRQQYHNSSTLLKSFPSQPLHPQVPQFNVDLNSLQTNGPSLNIYPNSERSHNLTRFNSHREISKFSNPFEPSYSPLQRNGLIQEKLRGRMHFEGTRSNSNGTYLNMKNSFHFKTPYVSQNPSLMNVGDDMNILKSVMDGSILKELSPPKENNQSLFLKPLLDNTLIYNGTKETPAEDKYGKILEDVKNEIIDEEKPIKRSGKKKKSLIENKEKMKKQKSVKILVPEKKYGKMNLKGLLWALVYPKIWMKEVFNKIEKTREEISNETNEFIPIITHVISTHCADILNSIYKEKSSLVLVSGEEKSLIGGTKDLSSKEIAKRSALIMKKLESLIGHLHKIASEQALFSSLFKFLGMLSGNKGIPPQNFFSEFELARLQFSSVATLKNMPPLRSKFIIGTFFLIRVVVYMFFIKPWENVKNLKKTSSLIKNLKSISSVFYHIVMDHFRLTVPPIPNNQAFLPPERRLKSNKNGPFVAYEEELDNEQEKKLNLKEEIIIGLYSRKKLQEFFNASKIEIEKLQTKIDEWLEVMYNLTSQIYNEERKKENSEQNIEIT